MAHANSKPLVWLVPAAVIGLVSGCSLGRVNERMLYRESEARAHLPPDAPLDEAGRFVEANGLKLTCCVSGPVGATNAHFALERKVGRFAFTEYDVAVIVGVTHSKRVETAGSNGGVSVCEST